MSTSVHITTEHARPRTKPKAGDRRYLKGRGVWQVRQQQIVNDPLYGRCHVVSNGKPVWEWVDEGGPDDRQHAWQVALAKTREDKRR